MALSVTQKLLLALLATVTLVLGAVLAVSWWNLRSGFSDYIAGLELTRFDALEEALAAEYGRSGDWRGLAGRGEAWHQLVRRSLEPPPGRRGIAGTCRMVPGGTRACVPAQARF